MRHLACVNISLDKGRHLDLRVRCMRLTNIFQVFSPDEDECADDEAEYLCEPCDRTYDDEESFRSHLGEHQTCGIDGCKFNAHELLVMAHIKMQHSSGLYDQIRNISTPDDIEKWREQRRRNYPSKVNIELRYKQQAEMLKRGERIGPNKDRFGRAKNLAAEKREKREKQKQAKRKKKKQVKKKNEEAVSLIDEKVDWNGTMFPFRGTKLLQDEESSEDELKEAFSDDEWDQTEGNNVEEEVVLNNALGALMGAYESDSEDEKISKISNISTNNNDKIIEKTEINAESHDNDITEVKILKQPVDLPDKATEMKSIERKRPVSQPTTSDDVPIPPKRVKNAKKLPPVQKTRLPRRPTLLQKLLDTEIRHERNVILQCVRYVINNNYFDKETCNIDNAASTSEG